MFLLKIEKNISICEWFCLEEERRILTEEQCGREEAVVIVIGSRLCPLVLQLR